MQHDELEDDLGRSETYPRRLTPELPTTPVIILFTDIKGSISYFERHGDVAGRAWVQHHNELVYPIIEQNDGRVVKLLGDSTMAAFNDRGGAIKAAVGMQRILKDDRAGEAFRKTRSTSASRFMPAAAWSRAKTSSAKW